jgi:hypothetical protein
MLAPEGEKPSPTPPVVYVHVAGWLHQPPSDHEMFWSAIRYC